MPALRKEKSLLAARTISALGGAAVACLATLGAVGRTAIATRLVRARPVALARRGAIHVVRTAPVPLAVHVAASASAEDRIAAIFAAAGDVAVVRVAAGNAVARVGARAGDRTAPALPTVDITPAAVSTGAHHFAPARLSAENFLGTIPFFRTEHLARKKRSAHRGCPERAGKERANTALAPAVALTRTTVGAGASLAVLTAFSARPGTRCRLSRDPCGASARSAAVHTTCARAARVPRAARTRIGLDVGVVVPERVPVRGTAR
jgi:hypothetical protein